MKLWKKPQNKGKPPSGKPKGMPPKYSIIRGLILWLAFFVILSLFFRFTSREGISSAKIPYSTFYSEVKEGNVKRISISELTVKGEFHTPIIIDERSYEGFVTILPYEDKDLVKEDLESGVVVNVETARFWRNAVPWIIMLLFIGFWIFFIFQMQSAPRGAAAFGRSKAKPVSDDTPKVTFDDVAGVDEAKE